MDASGLLQHLAPSEYASNAVSITPRTDMAALLTRTGVQFVRQNKDGTSAPVKLIGTSDLGGRYLYGYKVRPGPALGRSV